MSRRKMEKLPTINFDELSDEEKERIYEEAVNSRLEDDKPLRDVDRKLLASAARRAAHGRPKVGRGSKRIQVTMEASLLESVDKRAGELGMSRAKFLARAAEKMLGKVT